MGSSRYTGNELFTNSDITDSPEDWDIRVPPRSFLTKSSEGDFPLAVSPTAIGAGHEPGNDYVMIQMSLVIDKNNV